jgi:hypothetical protein
VERRASAPYTLDHRGHRFEVTAERGEKGTVFRLLVDEDQVAEQENTWRDPKFVLDELELGLDLDELELAGGKITGTSWRRGRVSAVKLVLPSGALKDVGDESPLNKPEKIPFEPPPGSRAHKAYLFQRDHPRLYAARHVGVAIGEVVIALLGIRIVIDLIPWDRILPDINLPDVDLPGIPWPDIPWPDINLPDVGVPGWLAAILQAKKYWLPIVIAIFVALGEVERRRKRQQKEAEAAGRAKAAISEDD